MSRGTSSHLAKYSHDIYYKYITPCAIMFYATSDAISVMPPQLRNLRSGATI
jgi:hypothetical protein